MKRLFCTCNAQLKVVSRGNADMAEWEKTRKNKTFHWNKIKHPAAYQLVLLCPKKECNKTYEVYGKSYANALHKAHQEGVQARPVSPPLVKVEETLPPTETD